MEMEKGSRIAGRDYYELTLELRNKKKPKNARLVILVDWQHETMTVEVF